MLLFLNSIHFVPIFTTTLEALFWFYRRKPRLQEGMWRVLGPLTGAPGSPIWASNPKCTSLSTTHDTQKVLSLSPIFIKTMRIKGDRTNKGLFCTPHVPMSTADLSETLPYHPESDQSLLANNYMRPQCYITHVLRVSKMQAKHDASQKTLPWIHHCPKHTSSAQKF